MAMKSTMLWRPLLLLVGASLACTLGQPDVVLPPTLTPRPKATEIAEADATATVDLDQDLHLGGDETPEEPEPTEEPGPTEEPEPTEEPTQEPEEGCTTLAATDGVYWVTLDEDGNVDEQVDTYPSGTTTILPVFDYECVPKRVDITTVFSLDGDVVYSDKESLKASKSAGSYGYPLGTTDGSAMDDGEWQSEFYVDDELLASGTTQLGGGTTDDPANQQVTVDGTVVDQDSGKPIEGALVIILKPGITVQQFADDDFAQDDAYTWSETNSKGEFILPDPLTRNVEYSLVVSAEGYQLLGVDGFAITDDLEEPISLDIQLVQ